MALPDDYVLHQDNFHELMKSIILEWSEGNIHDNGVAVGGDVKVEEIIHEGVGEGDLVVCKQQSMMVCNLNDICALAAEDYLEKVRPKVEQTGRARSRGHSRRWSP